MDGGVVTPSQDREGVPISSAQRFLAFCHFAIGCPFLEQALTLRVTPQNLVFLVGACRLLQTGCPGLFCLAARPVPSHLHLTLTQGQRKASDTSSGTNDISNKGDSSSGSSSTSSSSGQSKTRWATHTPVPCRQQHRRTKGGQILGAMGSTANTEFTLNGKRHFKSKRPGAWEDCMGWVQWYFDESGSTRGNGTK